MIQRAHRPDPEKPKRKKQPPATEGRAAEDAVLRDGARITEEFGRTPGWFLFLSFRSAQVWALARPHERAGLFTARSHVERLAQLTLLEVDAEARRPLLVLADLLGSAADADPGRVAEACRAVAGWAAGQDRFQTALLFAEVAALLRPDDARVLYEAGRYARQAASYGVAAKWLQAAMRVGRKARDWETYCRALSSLGVMYQKRGNLGLARRFHLRCLRAAEKRGIATVAGEAAHDLFVIEAEVGEWEDAERWAAAAARSYGEGHPRLPMFAHDLAFFWFERGDPANALRIFQALLPHFPRPADRVLVLSSIARAAGEVGHWTDFETSSRDTLAMIESAAAIELAAQSLLDLARGAAGLKQWDLAERTAQRALEVARQRAEGKVQIDAELLIDAVQREQQVRDEPTVEGVGALTRYLIADVVVRGLAASAAAE